MIPENLSYDQLLKIIKKNLIKIKENYKTLKTNEWYHFTQNDYCITIIDDNEVEYDFSYAEIRKYAEHSEERENYESS